MRSLAHVEKIEWLAPIEGRDKIELAGVLGYQLIVKLGEFKVGDICVYVECDSVLPERPEFEFLRAKGFRIKTMKMAGVVSQGIVFHPKDLGYTIVGYEGHPDSFLFVNDKGNFKADIGTDITERLGIKQYERTMDKETTAKEAPITKHKYPKILMKMKWFRQLVYKQDHREGKGFPTFISKTDETRIQNVPHTLKNKYPWVVTEKVDGQSGTFALVKRKKWYGKKYLEYIVCSRNLRLWSKGSSSYWKVSDKYDIKGLLESLIDDNEWVAIQGECIAPNVQGNKYKVKECDFYAFNLIYPHGRASSVVANSILANAGLKFVPIIDTDYILPDTVQEVLDYAHAKSALNKDTWREGCVFRSQDGKQSFKAVDPLFLLKYDE